MYELSLHIIDIVQNSIAAHAKNIEVTLVVDSLKDRVSLEIRDDGVGMDKEILKMVEDPFFTTKSGKNVGLGIPLLKETAEITDGNFELKSKKGEGTLIKATFKKSHIDLPPVGDLYNTILTLIFACEKINLKFKYIKDGKTFEIETNKLRNLLGDVSFSNPEVIKFLKKYIKENIKKMEA